MQDQAQMEGFEFSQDWFSPHIPLWRSLMEALPGYEKFLEIGSFEGRSACWFLQNGLTPHGSLYCVDTWEGSPEFGYSGMHPDIVKQSFDRFTRNIQRARQEGQQVLTFRNRSLRALADLISNGHEGTFDLVYVDASHQAKDALSDAVLAWALVKPRGLVVFDDYLWSLEAPLEARPKIAIDAFTSMFYAELETIAVGHQVAIRKR